jgi:hypothetical protein
MSESSVNDMSPYFNGDDYDLQDIGSASSSCPSFTSEFTIKNKTGGKNSKNLSSKVKFTIEEDNILYCLVHELGTHDWIQIAERLGTRNPRQCRERWNNYVNPELRKDPFTPEEDRLLEMKYAELGPKWNKISKFFFKRSDNSIRNRWMVISRHRSKGISFDVPMRQKTVKEHHVPVFRKEKSIHALTQQGKIEMPTIPNSIENSFIPEIIELPFPQEKVYIGEFDNLLLNNYSKDWEEFDFFHF